MPRKLRVISNPKKSHEHKCVSCGTIWNHPDSTAWDSTLPDGYFDEAHTCWKCGEYETMKHLPSVCHATASERERYKYDRCGNSLDDCEYDDNYSPAALLLDFFQLLDLAMSANLPPIRPVLRNRR